MFPSRCARRLHGTLRAARMSSVRMALTAAGLPPVAQMLKKRKERAPDTCTSCGASGHRSNSSICPLKTQSKIFDAVVPRSPSIPLSSLNFSDHYFALVTEVVTFCPGLLSLLKQMTPGYAPRGAWERCMLIAPRDEHLELLDEHSIAVLTREAVQELYDDAYSGDMSPNQLVTGIDFVDEGQTVTRDATVGAPSVGAVVARSFLPRAHVPQGRIQAAIRRTRHARTRGGGCGARH